MTAAALLALMGLDCAVLDPEDAVIAGVLRLDQARRLPPAERQRFREALNQIKQQQAADDRRKGVVPWR